MPATVSPQEDVEPAMSRPIQPKRALISVSDKSQLAEFAQALVRHGIELYSTGGTHAALTGAGCEVTDVASYTGFPEMMDGRVKTLHPKIFGGILARRDREDDLQSLADHGIATFDLVIVNLYPFEATIAKPGVTEAAAIEQIDIGGPSLVRAAAKNFADVAIATSPSQYARILAELENEDGHTGGQISLELRRQLAAEAFAHTAAYDRAIANYFVRGEELPQQIGSSFQRQTPLRYGENPHQRAAVYVTPGQTRSSLVTAEQLNGKELSYNNYLDLDAAWRIVRDFPQPAVSVIKHNNPCGASTNASLAEALQQALDGDPTSAFGSVLGINRPVDRAAAEALATPGLFIEAIIAPRFDDDALEILKTRPKWKQNVRLLAYGNDFDSQVDREIRPIDGGVLVQERDEQPADPAEWKVVTERTPTPTEMNDLEFGWALVRHVRSNAIVVVRDQSAWGVGAGQMSRVDAVEIAIAKAGARSEGAILASDAFFPFPDSIERAATAGIGAVIQPGGSKKDDAVIAAANEHQIAMVFTGRRHFKH